MKIRLKIRAKLVFAVLVVTAAIYSISTVYLAKKLKDNSLRDSYEIANLNAKENANLIRSFINSDMDVSRSMVHIYRDYKSIPQNQRAEWFKQTIKAVAIENPDFISVWGSWEINAIDSSYKKPHGRYRYTYYRENDVLKYKEETIDTEGDNTAGGYYKVKVSKVETMIDPYWFSYTTDSKPILEASTAVPLVYRDNFKGLFGVDIELSRYQTLISQIEPIKGSYAMMLSHNGTFVAHPNPELLGKTYSITFPKEDKEFSISEKIYNGENFSFFFTDSLSNREYYATFASIPIGKTVNPWSLGLIVPTDVLKMDSEATSRNAFLISIFGLFLLGLIIWFIAYSITKPLARAKEVLSELAEGRIDINKTLDANTGDEIEDISGSINILIEGLSKTSGFANEIGKGNLDAIYHKLSDGDVLGESLVQMRKSLIQAKEQEESRKIEDEKINWATQGVAKFSELLRENNDNMAEFSNTIVSNLVKYINANIGAMFLVNDDKPKDSYFELVASYAYDRRKYLNKRVELKEGLVGRCAQESETILLTDIPKDYVHIASGLGDESPSSLLLVPLKLNEKIYGVIELASFNTFDKYIIDFVEKIGESIAATVASIKISIKTVKLLEESKIKSEELASQEEEMRQNMEELQATQEEAARRTAEMESLINALNTSSYIIEYDITGKVISVNNAYVTLTNQRADQIIGSHHSDNMLLDELQMRDYSIFWEDLRSGHVRKETSKVSIGNKVFTFIETYSPIFNENQQVVKILKIAHNITDFIDQKEEESSKR